MKEALPAADLDDLQLTIDYYFKDRALLELAMTHESYAHEHGGETESNERLEFLGDSVLGMIICLYLYRRHPRSAEGPMAQVKAYVASSAYLADKARLLKLGSYLRMGKGELLSKGRDKANVLADAMEALIGAIYLDGGWEPAQKFVLNLFQAAMDNMEGSQRDFKSLLQEFTQRNFHDLPTYHLLKEEGPAHDRHFQIEVLFQGQALGRGEGHSKQIAGQQAAQQALAILRLLVGYDLEQQNKIIRNA